MLIGYVFAPFLEKKLGAIVSVATGTLTCVPVMLLLANGRRLGSGSVLFVIVGILLFLRTGLANATMPIQQEVQMVIVDKDLRPAFTGVVQIAYAVVGVSMVCSLNSTCSIHQMAMLMLTTLQLSFMSLPVSCFWSSLPRSTTEFWMMKRNNWKCKNSMGNFPMLFFYFLLIQNWLNLCS